MTTATKEQQKPLADEALADSASLMCPMPGATNKSEWQQPKPKKGGTVNFWPNGEYIDEYEPELSVVTKVNSENIDLVSNERRSIERRGIFHRDDPRVKENPNVRQRGVWDFTEEEKERRNLRTEINELKQALSNVSQGGGGSAVQELDARVVQLEQQVTTLSEANGRLTDDLAACSNAIHSVAESLTAEQHKLAGQVSEIADHVAALLAERPQSDETTTKKATKKKSS